MKLAFFGWGFAGRIAMLLPSPDGGPDVRPSWAGSGPRARGCPPLQYAYVRKTLPISTGMDIHRITFHAIDLLNMTSKLQKLPQNRAPCPKKRRYSVFMELLDRHGRVMATFDTSSKTTKTHTTFIYCRRSLEIISPTPRLQKILNTSFKSPYPKGSSHKFSK